MYILNHRDYCDFVGGLVATSDVWTTGESWSKTMTFINTWIIFLISQKLTLEALSILMYPGLWRTDPCMGWPQNNLSIKGYPPSAYICGFAVKWLAIWLGLILIVSHTSSIRITNLFLQTWITLSLSCDTVLIKF